LAQWEAVITTPLACVLQSDMLHQIAFWGATEVIARLSRLLVLFVVLLAQRTIVGTPKRDTRR
jgi:hypothetical protein